jgi:hypothetical protein
MAGRIAVAQSVRNLHKMKLHDIIKTEYKQTQIIMHPLFLTHTPEQILELPTYERPGIGQYFERDKVTTRLGQVEYVASGCQDYDPDKLKEAINSIANTAMLIPKKEKGNSKAAIEAYQLIMSKISAEKFPELIVVVKNAILAIEPQYEIKQLRAEHN